jgi:hypothetical protein
LSVAEDELSRIVLDIHDGPVQYLFSALSLLTSLQNELQESAASPEVQARLAQVGMLLESSLYEIRFFLGAFRPPEFRRRSLVSIVEGLVIQHEEWTGATVELETCDIPETVPLAVKMAIYRVCKRRWPTPIAMPAWSSSACGCGARRARCTWRSSTTGVALSRPTWTTPSTSNARITSGCAACTNAPAARRALHPGEQPGARHQNHGFDPARRTRCRTDHGGRR